MTEPDDGLNHNIRFFGGAAWQEELPQLNEMIEEYNWLYYWPDFVPLERDPYPLYYSLLSPIND